MKNRTYATILGMTLAATLAVSTTWVRPAAAAEPFIAQIVMFGGNFAPRGWAFCDGQILPIAQFTALFSLLGTTYGGDGQTTFALPDLRGRVAVHPGNGPGLPPVNLGAKSGSPSHTLTVNELPAHNHTATLNVQSGNGGVTSPVGAVLANDPREDQYSASAPNATMGGGAITVGNTGGSQSFSIMQPYQAVNFIIALQGIFPSRN